jgi:CopG family transcriptional regulator, nickel-responsive regulator
MQDIIRFGVSMDSLLLERFDKHIQERGYGNRSEAIRDLVRETLVREEWEGGDEVVGTITLVYDHHVRELSDKLTDIQHDHFNSVLSSLHIHLDHHNCLEVIVVRDAAAKVQKFADRLIGTRGVKHGKLSATTKGIKLR